MAIVHYPKDTTGFYVELRSRVDEYFKQNRISKRAGRAYYLKVILLLGLYLLFYAGLFASNEKWQLFVSYALLGGISVILGLNVGHDAAHGAISSSHKVNKFLLNVFELVGMSSFNWVRRHVEAHHLYPNVSGMDADVQQSDLVRIFPTDKYRDHHRYQYLYMPVIYCFYIFRWFIYRDFKDAFSKRIGCIDNSEYPFREIVKMMIIKLSYLFMIVFLPCFAGGWSTVTCITGFLILTITGSLTILLVLLSTHVDEDAVFLEPDSKGDLPYSWAVHQVITTADFSTENRWVNELFGGFNHHVVHHLFPTINHCHYPAMTRILVDVCQKYDLPYRKQKSLLHAIRSHFRLLYRNSRNEKRVQLDEVFDF